MTATRAHPDSGFAPAAGSRPWPQPLPDVGRPAGPSVGIRRPSLAAGLWAAGAGVLVGAGFTQGPAAAAVAALVAVLGLVVLRRPLLGAYLLVALVPVTSGLRRGLPLPGLRLSEVIATGLAALLLLTVERGRARAWTSFDWLALAYAGATLGLGLYDLAERGQPLTLQFAGTLLGPFQFFLLYRAVFTVVRTETERGRALGIVLLSSVPVSVLALLQYAGVGAVSSWLESVTGAGDLLRFQEAYGARMTGIFPHWQMLAGYLFVIATVGLCALISGARTLLPTWAMVGVTALAGAAMITTGTFVTAIGAVVAAIAFGVWQRRSGRVAAALALAAVLAVAAFGSLIQQRLDYSFQAAPGVDRHAFVPQSVAYRLDLWTDQMLPAIAGRWLTGYGPDIPTSVSFEYTESMYLTLLFRGGVPLLLIYAALMLALGAAALRVARTASGVDRVIGRALFALVALLAVLHLLEPYFTTSGLPHLIWILAALCMSAARDPAAQRS
jgi:O-antigen ligase/polysaccharide polymerase Wzy-like membrane protein